MSEHTPGPWTLDRVPTSDGTCFRIGPFPSLGVYDEGHALVHASNVRAHDYGNSKVGDELHANARLIAAAPDLLKACRFFSGLLNCEGMEWVDKTHPEEVDAADAAIKKAMDD